MKLISIKLCNFRQFYGETIEIKFSSGSQNTTIIHGNNGAGKTTLLNAFTWVLYEKFTSAFSVPELLVNKRSITEVNLGVSVECWVKIIFHHLNKQYQIKRSFYAYKNKDDKIDYTDSKLFMLIAGDEGRWEHPLIQPTDIIEQILPKSLHHYFFFDGEHIDHIFRYGEKNKIAEDTKELIGVKVVERGIEHLKKAKKTLQEELTEIGDIKTKQLLKQQTQLEGELEKLTKREEAIQEESANQETLKKVLSSRLLEFSSTEELQQLIQRLEAQESNLRKNLAQGNQRLKTAISSQGYTIFLTEAATKFQTLIKNFRERGELPSGIKKQFVSQLLERKNCICGMALQEGTEYYYRVQDWMNKAGIADVEETAIRLESKVIDLEEKTNNFWQEIDQQQKNINQWREELSQLETQLDEQKNKLRKSPDQDIKQLQQELDKIEDTLRELILEQGAIRHQINNTKKQLEVKSNEINKQKQKEDKQVLAQRRLAATENAIARLIEVKNRLERLFRVSLEGKIKEIFSNISFTPYEPRLKENYELSLIENTTGVGIPVAASTGENQILSLSLIAGIIDRVREWSQKNKLILPHSSTYPLVMDSPFGSLDQIYRRHVAKFIPQLANQLIVLVTKTQWRGEVAEEMNDYIGKEYVLVYNSPKLDCQEDFIELAGKIYPLVKRSPNQFEYTEIMAVETE